MPRSFGAGCFGYFSDAVMLQINTVYEFGPFRLEPKEHRLVRDGRTVRLTGKAFDTLCILVQRHGSLLSKQDLMNTVWPETTVEENSLDRNIYTLRKTLETPLKVADTSKRFPARAIGSSPRWSRLNHLSQSSSRHDLRKGVGFAR